MYRLPAHCLLNCSSSSCSKCVSALSFYHLANIDIDMVLCRIASEISLLKCKAAMWCGERRGRSRGPSGLLKTRRKRTTWQQTWPQQSEEGELAGEADAEPWGCQVWLIVDCQPIKFFFRRETVFETITLDLWLHFNFSFQFLNSGTFLFSVYLVKKFGTKIEKLSGLK